MKSSNIEKLEWQFFSELKKYNYTNYMDLKRADLTQDNAKVHKAFSSTVTRYFIFREKHADNSIGTKIQKKRQKYEAFSIFNYTVEPNRNVSI